MNTGVKKVKNFKSFCCEDKTIYYTAYCEEHDITFIMKDRLINDEPITSECVGWYMGKPDDVASQEVVEGKIENIARLEPEILNFKEVK